MKVKAITYAMLRKTEPFENDRAEVTIEVDADDKLGDVVREAKRICAAALGAEDTNVATYESIYVARGGSFTDGVKTPPAVKKSRVKF